MTRLTIDGNDTGQRLDRFLSKVFPNISHGVARRALRNKDIKINGKRTQADYRLVSGDVLDIYLNDDILQRKPVAQVLFSLCKPDVVYEDDNIILVNKAAGLPVHEDNEKSQDTLINRILAYLEEKGEWNPAAQQSFRPALCNRIDRNTTGIVIAAKNAEALRIMADKIKRREVKKYYLCLVVGKMPKESDVLTAFLEKDETAGRVYVSGKKSGRNLTVKTAYRVLKYVKRGSGASLLEVDLITGRTHQIRAHMAYIGHPVLGDPKYGDNRINREFGYKTQALCSYKLRFEFKTDGGILSYLNNTEYELKNIPFIGKEGDLI